MTDLITLLENYRKTIIYKGENIHGLYIYLEMIGDQDKLKYSVHHSHHFSTTYSTNNDAQTP